jgi:hypothetical protein
LPSAREVGAGLVQHVHAQRECGFVQHGQRAHGHAGLDAGVLDGGGRNAFAQHGRAFHHKGAEGAAGVEAARVVDHDGDLAQGLHIVKGAGHGFVVGLLAADDLDQLHLVDRAEEVDADELLGPVAGRGQAGDRQGRGVGGEEAAGRQQRLGLLRDLGLEVAALEHGFDDELAAGQVCGLAGRVMRESRAVWSAAVMRPFSTRGAVILAL